LLVWENFKVSGFGVDDLRVIMMMMMQDILHAWM
jgi:hypothetical protein